MKLTPILSFTLAHCAVANNFAFTRHGRNYTGSGEIYLIKRCQPEHIYGCLDPTGRVVGGTSSCATFEVTDNEVLSTGGSCGFVEGGGYPTLSISCSHGPNVLERDDVVGMMRLAPWIWSGLLDTWYVVSPVPEVGQRAALELGGDPREVGQRISLYWEKQTMVCGRECGPV